jgi:hypothetical protein
VSDPLAILRGAVIPWLRPLATNGAHWLRAQLQDGKAVAPPYLVVELASPGGPLPVMGILTWQGDIRLKAVAADLAQAETLAEAAHAVLLPDSRLADPDWPPGWAYRAERRTFLAPTIGRAATSGALYRITLVRR